jgi:hypothetical protein
MPSLFSGHEPGFRFRRIIKPMRLRTNVSPLVAIKLLHTAIRAFFAGCIVALPVAALMNHLDWAAALNLVVLAECAVLAFNRGRCPLTAVAARYTEDRADNFDIYLPQWLARHNKAVFGSLFLGGELIALWRWLS